MNKLLCVRSFFAACAIFTQILMVGFVFYNDFQCREEFYFGNSVENKKDCIGSLDTLPQWHCKCKYWGTNTLKVKSGKTYTVDYWMRLFDEWSVVMASIIFIPLILIELYRSVVAIRKICGVGDAMTPFKYCSFLGFFAMILDPAFFNTNVPNTCGESAMIIIDILIIGLFFRYCFVTNTSIINASYFIYIPVLSMCNALGSLVNCAKICYEKRKICRITIDESQIQENNYVPPPYLNSNLQNITPILL